MDNPGATHLMADQILIQFRSDLDAFRKELGEVKAQIKGVGDSAKKAGDDSNSAFGSLNSTLKSVGTAIAGAFAVQQVVAFGQEAIKLAKDAEGIERAFGKLNRRGLLDELRGAVQGTVSDVKLMQAAVKANNFKLPLDQLANLFKFAAQRARDTGEQVDYLVESIVLGISRKSIPILDNLGLSATEVQEEFAKTGDMATAVGNIISKSMGEGGERALSFAEKADRMTASMENAETAFGKFAASMTDSIFDLEAFSEFFNSIPKIMQDETIPAWEKFMSLVSESQMRMSASAANFNDSILTYSNSLINAQVYTEKHRDIVLDSITKQKKFITDQIAHLQLQGKETEHLDKLWWSLDSAFDRISEKPLDKPIKSATKATEENTDATKKNTDAKKDNAKVVDDAMITELEMQIEVDAQWKKSQDEIDARKKKQLDDWLKWVEDFYAEDEELHTATEQSKTDTTEEEARKRAEAQEELVRTVMATTSELVSIYNQAQRNQTQYEIDNIEERREAEVSNEKLSREQIKKINEKYDREIKQKRREQWQRDKEAALITTTLNTAAAVMRAFADSGYVGAIAAGIIGAAQLAVIASQPEPKFHSGEIDIRPEGKRRMKGGEFRATLIEGESVINAKATQKYRDELEAINDLNFDDLLIKKYILPVLEEQQAKAKQSFAENIASSLRMQAFSDGNIVEMLKRVNSTSRENTAVLAAAMKSQRRDLRQPS